MFQEAAKRLRAEEALEAKGQTFSMLISSSERCHDRLFRLSSEMYSALNGASTDTPIGHCRS
jgi:hypothetical protein